MLHKTEYQNKDFAVLTKFLINNSSENKASSFHIPVSLYGNCIISKWRTHFEVRYLTMLSITEIMYLRWWMKEWLWSTGWRIMAGGEPKYSEKTLSWRLYWCSFGCFFLNNFVYGCTSYVLYILFISVSYILLLLLCYVFLLICIIIVIFMYSYWYLLLLLYLCILIDIYYYCYVYVFLLIYIIIVMFMYSYWCVLLLLCLCILIDMYALFCIFFANRHSPAVVTEVFLCFFLSCKANVRVYLAKTGHGPHSS